MKIKVVYDCMEEAVYDDLKTATDEIEEQFAMGNIADRIVEVDDNGDEFDGAKEYGCSWKLTLEELE